jgi:iron complex outermembrane recepter protein
MCMMILYHIAEAQNKLTGKITEKESGEAINGATVYFPDLKTGAVSDTAGFYKVDNLPQTKAIVQVIFLGYKTIVQNVDLSVTSTLNIAMEQSITEISGIVVTGTSKATEIKRNPVPMVTLDRKELTETSSTNIIDALAKLPGISAVTTGPNISKPFIHGLGYNRVLTLFDGLRQEGQQWGDEHGVEVDENTVDRVEIIKGPASLTYGSDALAGVVNLLPAPTVPDGTRNGNLLANYQTNNGLYEVSASLAGNTRGFVWGGVVSHKQATNYQNKIDGRVYGTAFNENDLSGYAGLNKQWGYSHLKFSLYNDLQEIPDGSRDSVTRKFTKQISEIDTFRPIVSPQELKSYNIADIHQHIQHYKLYSASNIFLGESKLSLLFGYQQNIRREYSHPQYPGIPGLYLVLNTFNYDVKFHFPELKGWQTTSGINGMYQANSNKGTEFIIPDYHQFDIGPFVLIQKTINRIDLSGGIRYDFRFFNNYAMYTKPDPLTGFDRQVSFAEGDAQPFYSFKHTFSGLSGSMGATCTLSDALMVKANIARGFRAPNIAEISANGVHPGTLIYQIGNTAFKPEFSLQGDLGISYTKGHLTSNLELFDNTISNYIFNRKLLNNRGQDSVIIKDNQTYKFQQGKARLYGWEAYIDIHPHPLDWLHFENSLSMIYALNKGGKGIILTESSKYLPSVPPFHTNSVLRANIKKKFRYFSSLYLKIGMEYYAKQSRIYSEGNTETPTPGYILYNAGAGMDITSKHGKTLANLNILGSNLTNTAYQSHLSRLKYFEPYPNNPTGRKGIFNMGRNISFKLIVPLNF